MPWTSLAPRRDLSFFGWVISLGLLVLPSALLGGLAYRTQSMPVLVGGGVQALFALVFLRATPCGARRSARP